MMTSVLEMAWFIAIHDHDISVTLWQNMPAVLPSIYFSQQSSKQEAVAVYTRGSKGLLPGQACL